MGVWDRARIFCCRTLRSKKKMLVSVKLCEVRLCFFFLRRPVLRQKILEPFGMPSYEGWESLAECGRNFLMKEIMVIMIWSGRPSWRQSRDRKGCHLI